VEKWSESELGRRVTIAELAKLSDDDPRARALRGRLVDEIAFWIANIAIVVDPSHIVLGGGIVRSLRELPGRTQGLVSVMTPFPAEVRIAHFEADSALLGAGAVALSGDPHIHPAFPQGV
jgi:glucokinase